MTGGEIASLQVREYTDATLPLREPGMLDGFHKEARCFTECWQVA